MNQLVITVIVILFPGILAAVVCDKITIHSNWTSFKFGLYALLLGVAAYCVLQSLVFLWDVKHMYKGTFESWTQLKIWSSAIKTGAKLEPWEVIASSFLSIPTALFASWIVNYKVITKIAQTLRFTTKFGDENLYSYYLNTDELDWIYIRDIENKLTYQGKIHSHAENDHMQEIVLTEVSVYSYENSEHLYDIPTIYMSRPLGTLIIEQIPIERLERVNE